MPSSSSHPLSDLVALLRADLSERWRRGERVRVEDYLVRHPELRDHPPEILELIEAEFHLRLHSDTPPSIDEYAQRFPSISDEVRRRLSSTPGPEGFTSPPDLAVTLPEPRQSEAPTLPRIPGFEVLEEIGVGGMGVVYKARQLDLDRVVALKLIRTGIDASPQEVARFRTEARAVARLQHPNVVQIHHTGEDRGQIYFSMEYLPGGTLAARLRRGPMSGDEAARLVQRLAEGMQTVHAAGVLHRDLKPGNILLDAEGTPKVADFGLAKLLDRDDNLTSTNMMLGTPAYMSPEQTTGRVDLLGPASDIHALGVILYECLTGKNPFKGDSRGETLDLVRRTRPTPPRQHRHDIPPNLEAICLRCLEKQPRDRYASAGALAEDLGRFLAGEKTQARPMPFWRRWTRRRALVASGLLAILLATLGAVLMQRPKVETPEQRLQRVEEELRAGKAVELIGDGEGPEWGRWVTAKGGSKTDRSPDGAFALVSLARSGSGLYELLPRVPLDRYRLRARIRHESGDDRCEVGLFVGCIKQTVGQDKILMFVKLTFDDINDAGAEHDRVMRDLKPEERPQGLPRPRNVLRLEPVVGINLDKQGEKKKSSPGLDVPLFVGAGPREDKPFLDVALDVTPDELVLRWGQKWKAVGRVKLAALNADARRHASVPGFVPTFDPRGGAGLIITHGRAAFRDVVVEPLPKQGK